MATASAISPASSQRLPYLQSLGVDAVWLSPIFPSPMADFGYDISDYTGIDPLFGTHGGFRRAGRRPRTTAASRSSSTSCRTTPPTSIPGSSKAAARATIRSATGISGAIRRRTAGRRTTGCRNSAAAPGSIDEATGQYYYHAFLAAAAGSELAQSGSARGDLRRACASGCARASMAFAST